jgi:hypothetical protein
MLSDSHFNRNFTNIYYKPSERVSAKLFRLRQMKDFSPEVMPKADSSTQKMADFRPLANNLL